MAGPAPVKSSATNALDTSRIFIVILPKFVPRAYRPR
jgi:hypothetical protein